MVALAGSGGIASALLLSIGLGATTGAALVNYSGLPSATAEVHLLVNRDSVSINPPRNSFLGYLVETDGRRKQEIKAYNDEQDILELLAAIVPVIEIR